MSKKEKDVSYYDWELKRRAKKLKANSIGVNNETFEEKTKILREDIEKEQKKKDDNTNELGMNKTDFKEFINNWKKENL